MAEAKAFPPAKLIVGLIATEPSIFGRTAAALEALYGPVDLRSAVFPFDTTDYYEKQMGPGLERQFLSFRDLVPPDRLAEIKLRTNALEGEAERIGFASRRPVNIDPGILTGAALFMATAKDFAHRVPLHGGIYAHLEILFTKDGVQTLDWTYPDFRRPDYREFLLAVRRLYLAQRPRDGG